MLLLFFFLVKLFLLNDVLSLKKIDIPNRMKHHFFVGLYGVYGLVEI